ncbi:MAG: glycoside hydrolase family 16 protein [Kiritimatiellaeota bacterium]|nr:glycoside hydrolase family 16 protein [Kiritimatiellota bacterium]
MQKIPILALAFTAAAAVFAQSEKTLVVFDSKFDPDRSIHTQGPTFQMLAAEQAVAVTTGPNDGWPGFYVTFPYDIRDLSEFGGVSIDAYNPEDFPQAIGYRVDNNGADGSKHCNVEGFTLQARERKTLTVYFGFTDRKPGFQLDTANVTGICIFWHQPRVSGSLVLKNIRAVPLHPDYLGIAKPRPRVSIDFGAVQAEPLFVMRGGVWAEGAAALNGKRSLMGDTFPEGKQWFEFWESRPGLLAGSYSYKVKFQYKVVNAEEGATFYSLFRSQGKGWGKWDRGWTNIENLPAKKGQLLTQEHTVDLPRFKDYFMMFGINGKAKVIIDNIEITQGAPNNEGDLAERLAAKRNEKAARLMLVDFEGAKDPSVRIENYAAVTDKTEEVLLGKKSLVADTIGRGHEWNQFIGVGRGKLEAGYKYFVTVPVRMEKKGARGGDVYIFAGPEHERDGVGKIGWRSWNSGVGEDDIITTAFEIRQDHKYEIGIGIHNEARVIFDDIEIRREKLPEDRVPLLKPRDPKTMKLVFEDNFNGSAIDQTKWNIAGDKPHRGGVIRKSMATLDGKGHLDMRFQPDGDTYAMAMLDTNGKHRFKYGFFEARMMLPKHEGHWPGFWLYGDEVTRVGDDGRDGTEIDIMEAPWRHEDKVSHALHWDGYGDDHATDGFTPSIPGINEGWHTFSLDWQPDGYIFFVDGKETWRSAAGGVCTNALWLILSDELGGWSGDARKVDKKNFPDSILVDYVKVWQ